MNIHEFLYLCCALYGVTKSMMFLKEKDRTMEIKACVAGFLFFSCNFLFMFLFSIASTEDAAVLWYRLSFISRPLLFPSAFLLVFAFFHRRNAFPLWKILLIFLPAVPMVISGILEVGELKSVIIHPLGNNIQLKKDFWTYYYAVLLLIVALSQLSYFARRFFSASNNRIRGLAGTLFISFFITWAGGFIGKYFLTGLFLGAGIYLPLFYYLFGFSALFGSALAYRKYGFMKKNVPINVDHILNNISDGVMVSDAEGRIIQCNPAAIRITNCDVNGKCRGERCVDQVFPGCDFSVPDNPVEVEAVVSWESRKLKLPSGKTLFVQMYKRALFDEFDDFYGFLIIFQLYSKLEKAKEQYKLTGREIEIIQLLHSGLRNGEIADLLHVSQHTIRNHIQNIYTKTGVNNKTKLFKLVL